MSASPVMLDEFCQDLSTRDRRVELIGAFHYQMKVANRMYDLQANYQAAYTAFTTQPV